MLDPMPFVGAWSYRSFRNDPDLKKPFNDLAFGLGVLDLAEPQFGRLTGTLGGEGWSLDLNGHYTYGAPFTLRFQGSGAIGGELWVYDYVGYLIPVWPHGVAQTPAIVGSVVRTADHSGGQAKAGYAASFIAIQSR